MATNRLTVTISFDGSVQETLLEFHSLYDGARGLPAHLADEGAAFLRAVDESETVPRWWGIEWRGLKGMVAPTPRFNALMATMRAFRTVHGHARA